MLDGSVWMCMYCVVCCVVCNFGDGRAGVSEKTLEIAEDVLLVYLCV